MTLVNITIYGCIDCSLGTMCLHCRINSCSTSKYPTFPSAICEVDKCTNNNCSTKYFVAFKEVTTIYGKYIGL